MNLPSLCQSFGTDALQGLHGGGIGHTHLLGHHLYALHTAIPHNVFNVDIVTDERLCIVVHINDPYESVSLLPEIVEKTRVLAERIIAVGREIAWRLIITENKYNAAVNKLFKLLAARYISFRFKHN